MFSYFSISHLQVPSLFEYITKNVAFGKWIKHRFNGFLLVNNSFESA